MIPDQTSETITGRLESPATAIPDWMILDRRISAEARLCAQAILVLSKNREAPTREELAHWLGANERSISRWLSELRAAGVMRVVRVYRRNEYIFSAPIQTVAQTFEETRRSGIARSGIVRSGIALSPITLNRVNGIGALLADETRMGDRPVTHASGGGGDHDSDHDSPPPESARRRKIRPDEITTETGRWMVAQGFGLAAAYRHQGLDLDKARSDYDRRIGLGQRLGAINLAWNVAAPELAPVGGNGVPSSGEFTHSDQERARLRSLGFAYDDDPIVDQEGVAHE